ncbi:hypothetical protein KIL84_014273 [Mauremys mutica]|uniref:Uncharacterized protein n=1 Tax=Mauremys mutica TaxID=74926 RepID=A0A9D4B0L9_9SAUR|nr:hypothetical protein KIL84_014273 [Mauremys mutica]
MQFWLWVMEKKTGLPIGSLKTLGAHCGAWTGKQLLTDVHHSWARYGLTEPNQEPRMPVCLKITSQFSATVYQLGSSHAFCKEASAMAEGVSSLKLLRETGFLREEN